MSNLFDYREEKSLKEMAQNCMSDCEAAMNTAFKVSGCSIIDVFDGSADVLTMVGVGVKAYKNMWNLLITEAEMMDEMNEKLEKLDKLNRDIVELRKQNEMMERLLVRQDEMMKQILAKDATDEK